MTDHVCTERRRWKTGGWACVGLVIILSMMNHRLERDEGFEDTTGAIVGGGTGRRSRSRRGPGGTKCNAPVVKLESKKLVNMRNLPKNWTNLEKKGYYVFLNKNLPYLNGGGKYHKNRMKQKDAIDTLSQIYENIDMEEKLKFARQHANPYHFEYVNFHDYEGDSPQIKSYRPYSMNKLREYTIPLKPTLIRSFLQHHELHKYHNWHTWVPNSSTPHDYMGRDVPLKTKKAYRRSEVAFEQWVNTNESGAILRLPQLPELSDREIDRVLKYLSKGNTSLSKIPSDQREDARLRARRAAQVALARGSSYLAYEMYQTLKVFEKYRI